jgi:hypothetical protein
MGRRACLYRQIRKFHVIYLVKRIYSGGEGRRPKAAGGIGQGENSVAISFQQPARRQQQPPRACERSEPGRWSGNTGTSPVSRELHREQIKVSGIEDSDKQPALPYQSLRYATVDLSVTGPSNLSRLLSNPRQYGNYRNARLSPGGKSSTFMAGFDL